MALRTDLNLVKAVIDTALEDKDLLQLMNQANVIVTRKLGSQGLVSGVLKDIETWLTAHLIAIGKERQLEEEHVGDIELHYKKNPDGFLQQTTFGQTVLFLDTSGELARSGKAKVKIKAIKQIND